MILSDIVKQANDLADEAESIQKVTAFLNDAIAKINIRLNAELPYFDATEDTAHVLPEKWVRALLIPFAVGRIKQMDSSQFEYTDAYNEFMMGLDELSTRYVVPDEYKDTTSSAATSDIFTTNPGFPFGGRW